MDTTEMIDPVTGEIIDELQLAEQLLKQVKEQGVDLLGPVSYTHLTLPTM